VKFLVDNALSPQLASALRDAGYEALHVRELGMSASPDDEIFAYSRKNGFHVVTCDGDFGTLAIRQGEALPSVILLRNQPSTVLEDSKITIAVIQQHSAHIREGAILSVSSGSVRIRLLPSLS